MVRYAGLMQHADKFRSRTVDRSKRNLIARALLVISVNGGLVTSVLLLFLHDVLFEVLQSHSQLLGVRVRCTLIVVEVVVVVAV